MAALSIRNIDDQVRERLRRRAAAHGRSMEAEVRAILTEAVADLDESPGLLMTLTQRFAELGGVDLELPERSSPARAPDLAR